MRRGSAPDRQSHRRLNDFLMEFFSTYTSGFISDVTVSPPKKVVYIDIALGDSPKYFLRW